MTSCATHSERVLVIAEAGVNHCGSVEVALRLVDAAVLAGADVVKFQSFMPSAVISERAPKAEYQVRTTGSAETQLQMVEKLKLSDGEYRTLRAHCDARGIRFMSSPFDVPSVEFLADTLDVDTIKIPSGEITNPLLLVAVARRGKPIILSTGMSTLADVEGALATLIYGYVTRSEQIPTPEQAYAALNAPAAFRVLRDHVTLLHCTTEYPTPYGDVNLRALATLRATFGLPVGLSDHTIGTHISVAAVALGATVIEKHLTLDRTMKGPDHAASLEPPEFARLVKEIRDVEQALGDGIKRPQPTELPNMMVARKSIVAARAIRQGECYSAENLTVKRPGTGLSPMRWREVLGREAPRDLEKDELIEL
jgi:N-acetylneuraminate synthase